MARPIWSGVLSFGQVSVPVSLYAAPESHTAAFRRIQRGTSDRIRNKRVNERTGEEVAFGDIVKGFEFAEGKYVVVEPDELDRISPGRPKTIEIYLDTTYRESHREHRPVGGGRPHGHLDGPSASSGPRRHGPTRS